MEKITNDINNNHIKFVDMNKNRKRVSLDLSHPKMTDASFKNSCDINVIMAQYAKTGMLPSFPQKDAIFQDCTDIPSLEEAFNISERAIDAFYSLPSDIRKLIDNDPSKLETLLSDKKYQSILVNAGLLDVRTTDKTTKNDHKNDHKNTNKNVVDPLTQASNDNKKD